MITLLLEGWAVCATAQLLLWLVQQRTKNAGIVDVGWALTFALVIALWTLRTGTLPPLAVVTLAWSLRLGGYLIYRSAGARKVFFDGRSDFYGADFLQRYGRVVQVRPGWQQYFNSFRFSHALLPPDAPLRAALEQAGWRVVYTDKVAVLLIAPGT